MAAERAAAVRVTIGTMRNCVEDHRILVKLTIVASQILLPDLSHDVLSLILCRLLLAHDIARGGRPPSRHAVR